MIPWLEVRHLLPLQFLSCLLSSTRNSYVPLDLHDRHPQNHRVKHAWSRPRVCVSCYGMLVATSYANSILFSQNHHTTTCKHFREKASNKFLPELTCHKLLGTHDLFSPSMTPTIQSCPCHGLAHIIHLIHPTITIQPWDRIRRAMFRNGQDVTDSELRQEVQTPSWTSILGSTIVNRMEKMDPQGPKEHGTLWHNCWFLHVLKGVSPPSQRDMDIASLPFNSLPWRENARFDCHFQCCSLLGFMQFNICAVAD